MYSKSDNIEIKIGNKIIELLNNFFNDFVLYIKLAQKQQ